MNTYGYFGRVVANLQQVNETQAENIRKAGSLMADAIEQDRLIHVYGGGDEKNAQLLKKYVPRVKML